MHDRACAQLHPQGLQLHTVTAGFIDKAYMQPFWQTALALPMHKQWLEHLRSLQYGLLRCWNCGTLAKSDKVNDIQNIVKPMPPCNSPTVLRVKTAALHNLCSQSRSRSRAVVKGMCL